MKDAMMTLRLASATRRAVERFAREQGRSLSQAAERLIERGLSAREPALPYVHSGSPRSTDGLYAGGPVPEREDFRAVRRALAEAVRRRVESDGPRRR